jgi:putative inorganic carbon (HCO3(-)) transporter
MMLPGRRDNPLRFAASNASLLLLCLAVASVSAFSLLILSSFSSRKPLAVVLGAAAFALAGALSGNPRLLCLWMLMISLPFNLSKYFGPMIMNGGEIAYRIELSDVFLFALAGFLALDLATGARPGLRIPALVFPASLIFLRGCYDFAAGPWPASAGHETVRMAKVALLFLVVVNEIETPRRLVHCASALIVGLLVQASAGLAQLYKGAPLGLEILGETNSRTIQILSQTSVQGMKVWRVSAFMLHPNLFGAYLAVLLPAALALFLLPLSKPARLFFVVASALGVSALVATLSRSSWLSFAFAFVIFLSLALVHRGLRHRAVVFAACSFAGLLVVGLAFSGTISARLFQSKDDATIGRELFKEDAKRMIAEKPLLGWGLNSYTNEVAPFMKVSIDSFEGKALPPVHHIYYLWWTETGIIGLFIHLAVWGIIVWTGVRNLRIADRTMYAINAACLAGILGFVSDGFFSFTLRMNAPLKLFWVLAGMIFAIRYWWLRASASRRFVYVAAQAPGFDPRPVVGEGALP